MKFEETHTRPARRLYGCQAGFTLLEVLISLVILSIGLLSSGLMQGYFATGTAESRQMIRATDIATSFIEELANTDSSDSNFDTGSHTKTVTDYSRDYELDWTVTDNNDGTLFVDIDVSWNEGETTHTFDFSWVKHLIPCGEKSGFK